MPSEPAKARLPSTPRHQALARKRLPVLQFGEMKPFTLCPSFSKPPTKNEMVHHPRQTLNDTTTSRKAIEESSAALHVPSAYLSKGTQCTLWDSACHKHAAYVESDKSAPLFSLSSQQERCPPSGFSGALTWTKVGEASVPSVPTAPLQVDAKAATQKMPGSNKFGPRDENGPGVSTPPPGTPLHLHGPAKHHPFQISREALKVFTLQQQPPSHSQAKSFRRLRPVTSFNSYEAYEAAHAVVDELESCVPGSMPPRLGEHVHPSLNTTESLSRPERTCQITLSAQDAEAWSNFVAARLPAFRQTASSAVDQFSVVDDVFGHHRSDSPLTESLSCLPSSTSKPIHTPIGAVEIPTIGRKWSDEKGTNEKRGCTLYRSKSISVLETVSDIPCVTSQSTAQDKETMAMRELCSAFNSLTLDDKSVEAAQHLAQKTLGLEYPDYGSDWEEESHVTGECEDRLCDAPVLVDYNQWNDVDDNEWLVLSPTVTLGSCASTFDAGSDSEFAFVSEDEKPSNVMSTANRGQNAFDIVLDLQDEIRAPLPASPSTEDMIREDTQEQMRLLSEHSDDFIEVVGYNWALDEDMFAVDQDAWNTEQFKLDSKEKSPVNGRSVQEKVDSNGVDGWQFGVFPVIESAPLGETGILW